MNRVLIAIIALQILVTSAAIGQNLDDEIGFVYVKAEYLFETARYDDAVNQYNIVVRQDPKYKDALIKRGMAKNALGAYKGGKMDAMQYIDLMGITGTAAATLAKSELGMNQTEAALNSLAIAIAAEPNNIDYLETRAKVYEENGQLLKACSDWERAMKAGSVLGEAKARSLCGISKTQRPNSPANQKQPEPKEAEPQNTTNETTPVSSPEAQEDTGQQNQPNTNPQVEEQVDTENEEAEIVDDPTIPKPDDYRNVLEIDDDLIIDIYGYGLGRRSIKEVPSILILSDEDGIVSLDICVNNKGEITKAEFNPSLSTTAKKSLVSLAIRKSREFIFDTAIYPVQCGVMQFKIKGS